MNKYLLFKSASLYAAAMLAIVYTCPTFADNEGADKLKSVHYGFFSSTGADFVGWETKSLIGSGLYSYYSFGFPSLVTAGIAHYENYNNGGIVLTAGVGFGTVMNASVSYQWKIEKQKYFEFGAGYALFFEGRGLFPVISYLIRK